MKQADLTRQRLLRAGLELFTTRGYHATTTLLIARQAGMAEGTLYRHFAGKQALFNELYRGAAAWATQLVRQADAEALERIVTREWGTNSGGVTVCRDAAWAAITTRA